MQSCRKCALAHLLSYLYESRGTAVAQALVSTNVKVFLIKFLRNYYCYIIQILGNIYV